MNFALNYVVPPGPNGPGGGGPGGPGDGDDSKKPSTNRGGPAGGDPPGPPSDAPIDEDVADVTEVKISRREADKVIVPPFPKVTHLDSWMSHCIANVLGACADPNHEEWISWLNPAFRPNPDIDALNDSGHIKFKSIDIKLGIAMSAMLKSAGDIALDLYLDVNRKSSKYVRTESKLIKGRQIIAMMYESFRTRDRLDMVVTLEYHIKLQYQGDQRMRVFKQTWLECIDRMRPEDVPSDNALRDTLHAKIKDSPALKWELLVHYDMLSYDDPKRSYQHLLHLMDRCIQRSREQKMLKQTQNGLQLMIQGKDTLSAMAAKAKGSENATPAPKKPTKPPKNESAAPVLPQSKAKAHAKAKAGKGKGKGKDRERSASVDAKNKMKHIRCKFFFSETGECRNGDKCPYSHSKKTPERGRGTTPVHSRALSRSPSAGQGEKECFQYKKHGSCSRNNCPYKHVDPATPAEGKPKAAPKADAKSKAEAKPKPKGKAKALPAAPAIRLCRAWNPLVPAIQKRNVVYDDDVSECSSLDSDADSECSTDDEAVEKVLNPKDKGRRTQSTDSEVKKKVTFASDVRFQSSKPRRSYKDRGDKITKVDVKKRFVDNSNRTTELGFSMHKARLKAQMMNDMLRDGKQGDRHVYVRVPGSDRVREIIFYDGEDELHEYEVGPEERRKVKAFSIVNCMVQPTWIWSKIKFLMDTGCGHDLISQRKVEKHGLETLVSQEAISFQTANGVTNTDLVSNFQTESFTEPINAYVLDDTPSVLSVGKRCMKQGFGFVWPPGEDPFMINPEGKRISLFVNGDIPYVRAGSQKSIAHHDEMASTIKSILEQGKGENAETASKALASAAAVPGAEEEPDGSAEEYSPDFVPDEVPREDVPVAEAGRPPDPPDEGDEHKHDDDEKEIEVEGEGAPTRKAKVGTLKAEAKTLAHLCTHRYRNPYCEACIRAKIALSNSTWCI